MIVLSREQVRNLDHMAHSRFAIPGLVLMENAGRGATDVLLDRLRPAPHDPILVVAGGGNNGGDGFVIARHLHNRGHRVRVAIKGRPADFRGLGDAAVNYLVVEKLGLPVVPLEDRDVARRELRGAGLVVDALLGTGLAGEVRGFARDLVELMNDSGRPVFAVDIPSGLDCDTGRPLGVAVKATATATFAAMKRGFLEPGAEDLTGPVDVVDIGTPIVWE